MTDTWEVISSKEYKDWRKTLSDEELEVVIVAVVHLRSAGPALRRPLSGQIKASAFANMKELIPTIGNIRILYIFDPERRAVLLLGGDKTDNWTDWYRTNIPVADAIYQRHLDGQAAAKAQPRQAGARKKR